MSKTNPAFVALVDAIDRTLISGAAKAVRARKEGNVQLVAINAEEIYNEIIDVKFSPFKIPGSEVPDSALRDIANKIAKDLYKVMKDNARGKFFTVGQEAEFMAHDRIAILWNDSKKFIYFRSGLGNPSKRNNQKTFLANVMKPAQIFVSGRLANDPTNMFINENPRYTTEKKKLNTELVAEFEKTPQYEALKAREAETGNKKLVSNRLQDIRNPKKGNGFGRFPKHYWSKKFQDLFVKYPGQGTQLGHVFGGQVSIATNIVANRDNFFHAVTWEDVELLGTVPLDFEASALKKGILVVSGLDANVIFKRTVTHDKVLGEITILVPELGDKNAKSGADAQKAFDKLIVPELNRLKTHVSNIPGSPSYNKLLGELVEDIFQGKRPTSKSFTTKKKIKRKPVKIAVTRLSIKGSRSRTQKVNRKIKETKGGSLNLQSLMAFLNQRLHDKIKQNMGKGGSRAVLNYRTGTFAKSAKIKQLTPSREKGAINARVKYDKNPYSVYEPGKSSKATPGRNPARIFGRSIRQLLQEEKIATYRRVKVELIG